MQDTFYIKKYLEYIATQKSLTKQIQKYYI